MKKNNFSFQFNIKIIFIIFSLLLIDINSSVLDSSVNSLMDGVFEVLTGGLIETLFIMLMLFLSIPSFVVSIIFGFKYSNGGFTGFLESIFFFFMNIFYSSIVIVGYIWGRSYFTELPLFKIESIIFLILWLLIPINQIKKA